MVGSKDMTVVRFLVYNYDRTTEDEFLGEAILSWEQILESPEHILPLGNPNNFRLKRGLKVKGTLIIRAEINSAETGMLAHMGRPLMDFHLRVQPADIVLLDHARMDGVLVSAGTASRWNHIGIIVPGVGDKLLFFEATLEGVMLSNLEDSLRGWMRTVPGLSFGFRRLENLDVIERENITEKLRIFAQENVDKPYEKNLIDMARGIFKANKKEDMSSFFLFRISGGVL